MQPEMRDERHCQKVYEEIYKNYSFGRQNEAVKAGEAGMQFSFIFLPNLVNLPYILCTARCAPEKSPEVAPPPHAACQCICNFSFVNVSRRTCLLCPLITNRNPIAITISPLCTIYTIYILVHVHTLLVCSTNRLSDLELCV